LGSSQAYLRGTHLTTHILLPPITLPAFFFSSMFHVSSDTQFFHRSTHHLSQSIFTHDRFIPPPFFTNPSMVIYSTNLRCLFTDVQCSLLAYHVLYTTHWNGIFGSLGPAEYSGPKRIDTYRSNYRSHASIEDLDFPAQSRQRRAQVHLWNVEMCSGPVSSWSPVLIKRRCCAPSGWRREVPDIEGETMDLFEVTLIFSSRNCSLGG
jgi:hypothetical protein